MTFFKWCEVKSVMLVELSVFPYSILYFSRVGTWKCQLDYWRLTLRESESLGFSWISNMACHFCNFEVKLPCPCSLFL